MYYKSPELLVAEQASRQMDSLLALKGLLRTADGTIVGKAELAYWLQHTDLGGPSDGNLPESGYVEVDEAPDDGRYVTDEEAQAALEALDNWAPIPTGVAEWDAPVWARIRAAAARSVRARVAAASTIDELYAIVDAVSDFDDSPRAARDGRSLWEFVCTDLERREVEIRRKVAKEKRVAEYRAERARIEAEVTRIRAAREEREAAERKLAAEAVERLAAKMAAEVEQAEEVARQEAARLQAWEAEQQRIRRKMKVVAKMSPVRVGRTLISVAALSEKQRWELARCLADKQAPVDRRLFAFWRQQLPG